MTLSPVLSADVGRHNMARVLAVAINNIPCARSDIRVRTGLVSGTVTTMVEELIARGLLVETGNAQGSRGRPRRLLSPAPDRLRTVSVHLFPGSVAGEVRDVVGNILWSDRRPHACALGDAEGYVTAIAGMIEAATQAAADSDRAWVTDPVVVLPAIVDSDGGIVAALPLGLTDVDLRRPLMSLLGHDCGVSLINDGRLSALAEYIGRPPRERPRAMAYVGAWREGVGGGLIVEGDAYGGAHGLGGLVGHISVNMLGPACSCGAHGCLELYLALPALLKNAELDPTADLDVLTKSLANGDRPARAALAEGARALAAAIGTMSNYTDVDVVVLGGILPSLLPWLQPQLSELMGSRSRRVPHFLPEIVLASHGLEAPMTGAWLHARASVLEDPSRVPYL